MMAKPSPRKLARQQVESIPYFGRSWYRRGPGYWARRVVLTLICAVFLFLFGLITWGLVRALATITIPLFARAVLLAIVAAAIGFSSRKAWRAFNVVNRAHRQGMVVTLAEASGEPRRSDADRRRRVVARGAGLGSAAMLGGGALLVISVLFCIGWGVVILLTSLQRYVSPAEYAAWQRIERREAGLA
jgi:hypothetical protein